MYNKFNLYFQIEDSKDLIFYNNVDYKIENTKSIDIDKFHDVANKNKDKFNIYYISKDKLDCDYVWISDNYNADVVVLKTSQYNDFKNNTFKNIILIIDDEEKFLESMIYLYNATKGFIDFKLNNKFDKSILHTQFKQLSNFIIDEINNDNYKQVKQLTMFFDFEKFDTFGENSIFISPELNIYRHPASYWEQLNEHIHIEDFKFNEDFIHFSKPHILCINCETFYCERNIHDAFKETTEWKVPAFSECNKTTFISQFQKHIFNNIQDKISLDEYMILDKYNDAFDSEAEYVILKSKLCSTNKIKKFDLDYLKKSGDVISWEYNLRH